MTGIACRVPTLAEEWARCKPWLEAALEHDGGFNTIADVETRIAAGDAHFWPGKHAAAVTEFWYFPRFKVLNYWVVGGDLDELLNDMMPVVEKWAVEHDCTRMMAIGRKGLTRPLGRHGFAPTATMFVKELR